jgi:hypothetical protein
MADNIVPLWIGAISINQDNVAERGKQLRRMGQIDDKAYAVYSYVGPSDDDTEDVMKFIDELSKHPRCASMAKESVYLGIEKPRTKKRS